MHTAVASGAVVIVAFTYNPLALLLGVLVVWVCWSRVVLRVHTTAQVLTGTLLGVVLGGLGYHLFVGVVG